MWKKKMILRGGKKNKRSSTKNEKMKDESILNYFFSTLSGNRCNIGITSTLLPTLLHYKCKYI